MPATHHVAGEMEHPGGWAYLLRLGEPNGPLLVVVVVHLSRRSLVSTHASVELLLGTVSWVVSPLATGVAGAGAANDVQTPTTSRQVVLKTATKGRARRMSHLNVE
jgi:hypothetical protein